jgi:hypothetical protein
MRVRAEGRTRAGSVIERGRARAVERIGRGDANEHPVERTARERSTDDLVLLRRVEEGHRGGALAQVCARHLAGLLRLARAVEDVVCELEGDAERGAVGSEALVAA